MINILPNHRVYIEETRLDQPNGTHQNLSTAKSLPKRMFDRSVGQFFTFSMNTIAKTTKRFPWARKRLRTIKVLHEITYGSSTHVHNYRGAGHARGLDNYIYMYCKDY